MSRPRYIIVTGYHANPNSGLDWFHELWWRNTQRYAADAERLFVISSPNNLPKERYGEWIILNGDLAASREQLAGMNENYLCAGTALWILGAMLAYLNECDLVYKEHDCLAFGPWVQTMYRELPESANVICGNGKLHGISTVLFMVRHRFIPQFVQRYIAEGPENVPTRISEHKFKRMEGRWPEDFRRYSFGYDTDRPFNANDPVFMVQKITRQEMQFLANRGMINIQGMPADVTVFSNHNP
jgi:hypothetical protein